MTNRDVVNPPPSGPSLTEAQFRAVMDGVNALVYVADMETYEVLFINRVGRELFGEITGRPCWASLQRGQSGPCPFCTNAQLLDERGQPREPVVWDFCNTITYRWFECHDRAIPWADGRFVRLEVATDITERKLAEANVRANEDRLDFLLQLGEQARYLTEEEICNRALEKAVALTESHTGYLQSLSPDKEPPSVSPIPTAGESSDGAGLSGSVRGNGGNEYTYPAGRKGQPASRPRMARSLSATAVDRGGIQIIIGVGDTDSDYTRADVMHLHHVANALAKIVTRRRLDAALERSEERFRFLVEGTEAVAWELDIASFLFTYVSPQAERLLGYPVSDWYKEGFWVEHLHPDDREQAAEYCSSCVQKGEDHRFEYRMIKADGATIWVHDVTTITKDEAGEPVGLRGLMLDITERKEVEADLALAGMVFETVNEGMLVTDAQARIISVNPAFERITGYREGEALGRNPRFLKSGLQDKAFYEAMWSELTQSGQWEGDVWNRRKTGESYAQHLSVVALRDGRGVATNYLGVFNDITSQKRHSEAIRYHADHDTMTGLVNRRLAFDRLRQAIVRAERQRGNVAVLLLDLDGFKQVNDSFGHAAGDLVLIEVARRLTRCVRESDTVARFGGDEFLLLFPEIASQLDVELVAAKLLAAFELPCLIENLSVHLGMSTGIALFPDDAFSAEELIRKADAAMYRTKGTGKNADRALGRTTDKATAFSSEPSDTTVSQTLLPDNT